MIKKAQALILSLLVSAGSFFPLIVQLGCTKSGDRIASVYVDPIQYQSYDCEQIQAALIRISARVADLTGQLNKAANNDKWLTTAGVIIFWPALFALGGDEEKEAQLARLKGEYEALQSVAATKKCGFSATSNTIDVLPINSKATSFSPPPVSQSGYSSLEDLKERASMGDDNAQYILGTLYAAGKLVPQSFTEAYKWFQQSATKENPYAQLALGFAYATGEGVTQNYFEAMKWFQYAADQDNASAQFNLALLYENGQGVPQDFSKAVKWYGLSAEQGNVNAQLNLGIAYLKGLGIKQDNATAYIWFALAADKGNAQAKQYKDFVKAKIEPTQLKLAEEKVRNWKPKINPSITLKYNYILGQ
ncbi:MAG: tetratricopeptide repeat protein [Chitinophagaceae bacterium]